MASVKLVTLDPAYSGLSPDNLKVDLGNPLPFLKGHQNIHVQHGFQEKALDISFRKTDVIPFTYPTGYQPTDLGNFPLYNVEDYKETLPANMVAKGGCFMPVREGEAMRIVFVSTRPFSVKVLLGGINAISGLPAGETSRTMAKSFPRGIYEASHDSQDYIVFSPTGSGLQFFESTVIAGRQVSQFTAVPAGTGQSFEAQARASSTDSVGGVQILITPMKRGKLVDLVIKPLSGSQYTMIQIGENSTVYELMKAIEDVNGTTVSMQTLIFNNETLEQGNLLSNYGIKQGSLIHQTLNIQGGGIISKNAEKAVGTGNLITQKVIKDPDNASRWDIDNTVMLNIQLLNSSTLQTVTGPSLPPSTIDPPTYMEPTITSSQQQAANAQAASQPALPFRPSLTAFREIVRPSSTSSRSVPTGMHQPPKSVEGKPGSELKKEILQRPVEASKKLEENASTTVQVHRHVRLTDTALLASIEQPEKSNSIYSSNATKRFEDTSRAAPEAERMANSKTSDIKSKTPRNFLENEFRSGPYRGVTAAATENGVSPRDIQKQNEEITRWIKSGTALSLQEWKARHFRNVEAEKKAAAKEETIKRFEQPVKRVEFAEILGEVDSRRGLTPPLRSILEDSRNETAPGVLLAKAVGKQKESSPSNNQPTLDKSEESFRGVARCSKSKLLIPLLQAPKFFGLKPWYKTGTNGTIRAPSKGPPFEGIDLESKVPLKVLRHNNRYKERVERFNRARGFNANPKAATQNVEDNKTTNEAPEAKLSTSTSICTEVGCKSIKADTAAFANHFFPPERRGLPDAPKITEEDKDLLPPTEESIKHANPMVEAQNRKSHGIQSKLSKPVNEAPDSEKSNFMFNYKYRFGPNPSEEATQTLQASKRAGDKLGEVLSERIEEAKLNGVLMGSEDKTMNEKPKAMIRDEIALLKEVELKVEHTEKEKSQEAIAAFLTNEGEENRKAQVIKDVSLYGRPLLKPFQPNHHPFAFSKPAEQKKKAPVLRLRPELENSLLKQMRVEVEHIEHATILPSTTMNVMPGRKSQPGSARKGESTENEPISVAELQEAKRLILEEAYKPHKRVPRKTESKIEKMQANEVPFESPLHFMVNGMADGVRVEALAPAPIPQLRPVFSSETMLKNKAVEAERFEASQLPQNNCKHASCPAYQSLRFHEPCSYDSQGHVKNGQDAMPPPPKKGNCTSHVKCLGLQGACVLPEDRKGPYTEDHALARNMKERTERSDGGACTESQLKRTFMSRRNECKNPGPWHDLDDLESHVWAYHSKDGI